ncbi:MAG: M23 family metallopeptidase [Chitinispirillaceae bacterium]
MITCSILLFFFSGFAQEWKLPVASPTRRSVEEIHLTELGVFGMMRKERPGIGTLHHTGIDIRRPDSSYSDQPIYPAAPGEVISVREDGPYGQIIIRHDDDTHGELWTVYEHIGSIVVSPGDKVFPDFPIAYFFTTEELDQYGWQFNHVHFEIVKSPPRRVEPSFDLPDRHYISYTLECLTREQLGRYMIDPMEFFREKFGEKAP